MTDHDDPIGIALASIHGNQPALFGKHEGFASMLVKAAADLHHCAAAPGRSIEPLG